MAETKKDGQSSHQINTDVQESWTSKRGRKFGIRKIPNKSLADLGTYVQSSVHMAQPVIDDDIFSDRTRYTTVMDPEPDVAPQQKFETDWSDLDADSLFTSTGSNVLMEIGSEHGINPYLTAPCSRRSTFDGRRKADRSLGSGIGSGGGQSADRPIFTRLSSRFGSRRARRDENIVEPSSPQASKPRFLSRIQGCDIGVPDWPVVAGAAPTLRSPCSQCPLRGNDDSDNAVLTGSSPMGYMIGKSVRAGSSSCHNAYKSNYPMSEVAANCERSLQKSVDMIDNRETRLLTHDTVAPFLCLADTRVSSLDALASSDIQRDVQTNMEDTISIAHRKERGVDAHLADKYAACIVAASVGKETVSMKECERQRSTELENGKCEVQVGELTSAASMDLRGHGSSMDFDHERCDVNGSAMHSLAQLGERDLDGVLADTRSRSKKFLMEGPQNCDRSIAPPALTPTAAVVAPNNYHASLATLKPHAHVDKLIENLGDALDALLARKAILTS